MFQFGRFPSYDYEFIARSVVLHHGGFPIRKSAAVTLICSLPQLIAACHVLLRLLMPRHSPYALLSLNSCRISFQIFLLVLLELLCSSRCTVTWFDFFRIGKIVYCFTLTNLRKDLIFIISFSLKTFYCSCFLFGFQ